MRKLNDTDVEILKRLAPEVERKLERGERLEYRSVLPPVSMHFAEDDEDFEARLDRLTEGDLAYLAERIIDGTECLLCISADHARIFADVLEMKVSSKRAEEIRKLYESNTGYAL